MKKNIAVILAGGSGSRAGFSRPKQLIRLAGQPIIFHAIQQFQLHTKINEIVVVANKECISEIEQLILNQQFTKVKKILLGGSERYESSLAAISSFENDAFTEDIKLIFHDAVRPLVSQKIIGDVIEALNFHNAVDVVVKSADTVVVADPVTGTISQIPDRNSLRLGQTPQGFSYNTIREAYRRALQDVDFKTTDDCGVVLKYMPEEKIFLVEGSIYNLKLTYPEDLLIIDKFMQVNASRRLFLEDGRQLSALKGKVIVIFGGTSGIGASMAKIAVAYGAKVYAGGRSTGIDITNSAAVKNILSEVAEKEAGIDAVVNSAAVLLRQPLINMTDDEILHNVNTNYIGAVNVAKSSFDYLKRSNGSLLLFSSSSYTYGRSFYAIYSSSKAAIVNLAQALADEWSEFGISVNCVCPARTLTPMRVKNFGQENRDDLLDPDAVARASLGVLIDKQTGYVFDITKS